MLTERLAVASFKLRDLSGIRHERRVIGRCISGAATYRFLWLNTLGGGAEIVAGIERSIGVFDRCGSGQRLWSIGQAAGRQ